MEFFYNKSKFSGKKQNSNLKAKNQPLNSKNLICYFCNLIEFLLLQLQSQLSTLLAQSTSKLKYYCYSGFFFSLNYIVFSLLSDFPWSI